MLVLEPMLRQQIVDGDHHWRLRLGDPPPIDVPSGVYGDQTDTPHGEEVGPPKCRCRTQERFMLKRPGLTANYDVQRQDPILVMLV
jgi:hypothetical protein